MERLIEEIPNFFTIWNVIFLAKAMGVTFLLTAIGCLVGFSVGGLLAIFRKTKSIYLFPIRFLIIIYTEIFRRIPFLVSLLLFFYVFQIGMFGYLSVLVGSTSSGRFVAFISFSPCIMSEATSWC